MTNHEKTNEGPELLVGFDLGHGETAVCTVWADTKDEPRMADLQGGRRKTHPTAVALVRGPSPQEAPRTVIGSACFNSWAKGAVEEIHFAFKSADLEDGGRTRRAIELFVGHAVQMLTDAQETNDRPRDVVAIPKGTRIRWLFGAPSGWSKAQRKQYQNLLTGLCPGRVDVVPESRAALLYGRESRDLPDPLRQLTGGAAGRGSCLVIDLGSSTADYTVVDGLSAHAVDTGNTLLGASLIDKELLRRTVEDHRDAELLWEILADDGSRSFLEYQCREAKEHFFATADPQDPDGLPQGLLVSVKSPNGEVIDVSIRVTPRLMEEITHAPLDTLNGASWSETFRADLEKVSAGLGVVLPDLVMMTGGASRMRFAQDIVREVFDRSQLVLGAEPEFAIAKGLVIAGRARKRAEAFRADVQTFLDSGRIESIIDETLPELAGKLGALMTAGLVEHHLIPAVRRWRNGDLDLVTDIEREVTRTRDAHLSSPYFRRHIEAEADAWSRKVSALVDGRTAEICRKHDIPPGAVSLSQPFVVNTTSPVQVDSDMAVDNLNTIGNTAAIAMGYVTGVIGMAVVAVSLNPVGAAMATVVAVIVVIVAALRGKEEAMKIAKNSRMPLFLRKLISEERLLDKIRTKTRDDATEQTAAAQFAETFLSGQRDEIVRLVGTAVRQHLETAAGRTELLIEPAEGPVIS
ncbi:MULTISPECIES: Hsp70 family protein [Streptomyces]|uniref:Hsp70 family protein n=1 Tax=Streptomyces TaxID=1883 RepID=UPI0004C647FE|nr:hypothetical protein [Streptomyces sp. NRRL S-475]